MSSAPLTRRADLVREQLSRLPHGKPSSASSASPVRAGKTGSGDDLLVLTWSADDLARQVAAGVRLLSAAGLRAGMRIANTLPGALATPGALLLGDVIEGLGGLDVPLGTIDNDASARQAWELVDRVEAAVLVLDPSSGERFLSAAPSNPRTWLQGIVWLRTDAPFSAPRVPEQLAKAWQRVWLAIPEAACFVAIACERGRYHVDQEISAEVVDPATGEARTGGEVGQLALRTAIGEAPVARYLSGLAVRAIKGECECKMAGPALEVAL